jgi:hypothetical protein
LPQMQNYRVPNSDDGDDDGDYFEQIVPPAITVSPL